MNRFPLEIVHRILEYHGSIKYRKGKFMNQISPEDDRYEMLLSIPIIRPKSVDDRRSSMDLVGSSLDNARRALSKDEPPQRHGDYMQITSYRKNFVCKKHMYPYTGIEPLLMTHISKRICCYSYTNHGIRYTWVIYKTPPTFIESVMQHVCKARSLTQYALNRVYLFLVGMPQGIPTQNRG